MLIRFAIHGNGYNAIAADAESVMRCLTSYLSPTGRKLRETQTKELAEVRHWAENLNGGGSIRKKMYTVCAFVVPDSERERPARRLPLPPVPNPKTARVLRSNLRMPRTYRTKAS